MAGSLEVFYQYLSAGGAQRGKLVVALMADGTAARSHLT
jgi:hypothetical protein